MTRIYEDTEFNCLKTNENKEREVNATLNRWGQIASNYKLNLNAAQAIYSEILKSENVNQKNALREKLILGTIYVLFDYLKETKIINIESATINLDDLLNAAMEAWIFNLDSGKLREIRNFNQLFDRKFYQNLFKSLGVENSTLEKIISPVANMWFLHLFALMIDLRKKGRDLDYLTFVKFLKDKPKIYIKNFDYLYGIIYPLLEAGYNACSQNGLTDISFSQDMVNHLSHLILILCFESNCKMESDITLDYEGTFIEKEAINSYYQKVFQSDYLGEEEKKLLSIRYGLNDSEPKYISTLAKEQNKECLDILRLESDAIRKLRKNTKKIAKEDCLIN